MRKIHVCQSCCVRSVSVSSARSESLYVSSFFDHWTVDGRGSRQWKLALRHRGSPCDAYERREVSWRVGGGRARGRRGYTRLVGLELAFLDDAPYAT